MPPVDLARVSWAAQFLGISEREVARRLTVLPGRWWFVLRTAVRILLVLWFVAGVWVGLAHLLGDDPWRVVWTLAWWPASTLVAWFTLRGRWSLLVAVPVALAWPAYAEAGTVWSWVVYGWLLGAMALPRLQASVSRPVWSLPQAAASVGVATAVSPATATVVEPLTVIPAVRVVGAPASSEQAIVLDQRVALIGGPSVERVGGCEARTWPTSVVDDPQRAVEEIGRWLLADSDGWRVDRRCLGAVAPPPAAGGR